jgi:hypothetical protein
MWSMKNRIYQLLAELDDLLLVCSLDSPQVRELIQDIRKELERNRDWVAGVDETKPEMLQVPPESDHVSVVYTDDLLSGASKDKLGKVDFKELLSVIWRKHAGKRYHMRWSEGGEIELVVDEVVSVMVERMQDGVRVRLVPYIKE